MDSATKTKKSMTSTDRISEDEAALYDRQIRLWGLEAQNRLRGARVLLAGLTPLGAEVAKNLVLAGVNSVALLDGCSVSELDARTNFVLPQESVGQNRAEASLFRVQELNPMVKVSTEATTLEEKQLEYFRQFDFVCLFGHKKETLLRVNSFTRELGIRFLAGDCYGMYGYAFIDLINHEYAEEEKRKPQADHKASGDSNGTAVIENDDGTTVAKKRKIAPQNNASLSTNVEDDVVMVKKQMEFCLLADALDADWSSMNSRALRRVPSALFLLHAVQQLSDTEILDLEEDNSVQLLKSAWLKVSAARSLPANLLSEEMLRCALGRQSPVAAIVGGVAAQEVIKAVSQKDAPLRNFFLFSGDDCSGTVKDVGLITPKTKQEI